MKKIGSVAQILRYPVKSMKGEAIARAYVSFSGLYGDRVYALVSPERPKKFPFLTARQRGHLLRYRPVFRAPERTLAPHNVLSRGQFDANASPVLGGHDDFLVDIETPTAELVNPYVASLAASLECLSGFKGELTFLHSQRALTDCRPLSMVSIQAVRGLSAKGSGLVDIRRFRPNVVMDLGGSPKAEHGLLGGRLRIGDDVVVYLLEPDMRCKVIDINPDTGDADLDLLKQIVKDRQGALGVYAAVLVEGLISETDPIYLL